MIVAQIINAITVALAAVLAILWLGDFIATAIRPALSLVTLGSI